MPDPIPARVLSLDDLLLRYDEHALIHEALEDLGSLSVGPAAHELLAAYVEPNRTTEEARADDLLDDYNSMVGQTWFMRGLLIGASLQAGVDIDYSAVVLQAARAMTPHSKFLWDVFKGREVQPCPDCEAECEALRSLPLEGRIAQYVGVLITPDEALELTQIAREIGGAQVDELELKTLTEFFERHEGANKEFLARDFAKTLRSLAPEDFGTPADTPDSP